MNIARRFTAFCFAALVTVPLFASISGSVMNSDGEPIAGAKVSLFAPETIQARRARYVSATPQRTALATVTTDAKGLFHVDSPKDQPAVDVTVEANGYAPSEASALADEEIGAIVLTAAPAKHGTITANGKGVANATVIWVGEGDLLATTDANGHYSVPDPSKWSSRVVVLHPDFAPFDENTVGGALRSRRIGVSESISPDVALVPGVAVHGKVVAADGTTPAAGAEIFIDSWPVAKTAADGTFTIAHAPKTWHTIEAHSGDLVAARTHIDTAVALKLTKASSIAGRLIDGKTKLPIASTEVTLGSAAFGGLANTPLRSSITDAKGNFSLTQVIAGNYVLNVSRHGYGFTMQPVAVTAGQSVNKTIYGTPHAQISGTVTDEDHRPVAAAHITSRNATREGGVFMIGRPGRVGRTTWSGPDGRYVLRDVIDAESVIVDAAKKGFPQASTSAIRIAAGDKKSGVNLTIPRGVAFSGRVLDKDGKPLSGVAVGVMEASRDNGNMRRMIIFNSINRDDSVRTGTDGRFTLRVKEGSYDFNFKREGFATKTLRAQSVTASSKPVDVTLDPGAEITGRVTRGGAGVEGVNVTAVGMDGLSSALTAADGSFRLADLTPGQMMLNASKFDAFIMDNRPVTAPAHDVNIDLPLGGRITGHVVDKATNNPVTSFEAGVSTSRGGGGMVIMMPPMLKPFTSDDGSFTLENVRPGPTEVVVNAPGYTSGHVSNVVVEDGKTSSDVEVALETGVRLIGHVSDASGTALAGVSVASDVTGGGRVMRFNMMNNSGNATDPNGDYVIDGLEPGQKSFTFSRSGYLSETRSVNLTGKEVRLDVQLSNGMRIAGVVTSDSGTPIPDAYVSATSASDSTFGREARTDPNGGFTMDGLAPGHYTFSAAKDGYARGFARDVDVTTVSPVHVTLTSGGVITGHVTGLSADELQSATVIVSSTGTGQVTAPVDSSGNYRVDGAPTGTLRVAARTGAMFSGVAKSCSPKTVNLDPGGSVQVDLEFQSSTAIRGRVTRNGAPLSNAGVVFLPQQAKAQTNASTRTDNSGNYEVDGLDDGPYAVQVLDFERFTPMSTHYEVHGSGSFDIDIKTVTLRGNVVDASTGEPLSEAHVELHGSGDSGMLGSRAVLSDTSGTFLIDNVPAGAFQISADKDGYGNDTRSITIGDSAPDLAPFKLSPSDGITLTVVDARDGRALAASTHAVDAQGHTYDSGGFGMGGPAPIHLTLSPGAYTITVAVMGYAPRTLTGVMSPSRQNVAMTPGGSLQIRSKSTAMLRGRLIDANGIQYGRNPFSGGAGLFTIAASPGVTTIPNVAPGTYTLQVLDANDQVVTTVSVNVVEGQAAMVSL